MSQSSIRVNRKQAGITSLMVVIFATLLLSVITLSFAYLMNRELQRSSDDELSQSAYDSAMAGVEDAKRAIILAQSDPSIMNIINNGDCRTIALTGVAGDPADFETVIQSSTGVGDTLNQAYTCVTIDMTPFEYEANIDRPMKSAFVPLKATDEFNKVRIEWHAATTQALVNSCSDDGAADLCPAAQWGDISQVPALLRAQLITPGSSISYADLNSADGGTTVFLYPKQLGGTLGAALDMDLYRRYVNPTGASGGVANSPEVVECEGTAPTALAYRCWATLTLTPAIGEGSETSLLRLTSIYNATSFRITLLDDTTPVSFDGVQPVVDSTGRANDLFRRVQARLSLVSEADYPEFAVDIDGSLCKDFYVYEGDAGRVGGTCSP